MRQNSFSFKKPIGLSFKFILSIVILLFSFSLTIAQAPDLFNYQGVARETDGKLITNRDIKIQITILSISSDGPVEFREGHDTKTNDFGLFNIRIGAGNATTGNLTNINWGSNKHYVKVQLDLKDGNGFIDLGTTQLYSVPYALYANQSGGLKQNNFNSDNGFFTFTNGDIALNRNDGSNLVLLSESSDNSGSMRTLGPNGSVNVLASSSSTNANHGFLTVRDENNESLAGIHIRDEGSGRMYTSGPNGNLNITNSTLNGFPNNGFIRVHDEQGNTQAGLYVDSDGNGIVFADMVDALVDHPLQKNIQIKQSYLQGSEAGTYLRGTAELLNGVASVDFPDYFEHLVDALSMTVMITPLSAVSKGIAVIKKGKDGFIVKELLLGSGSYEFDWEVKAKRKGFENYHVIQKKITDTTEENRNEKLTESGKED